MQSDQLPVMAQIDALIAASDAGNEPLLDALRHGRLSRDELRVFAGQYFRLIDSLPRFVTTVHSVTADANWRRMLLNVLVPLELHPPSAADLWLQTCAALGLFSDTVRAGEATASTAACLSDYEYLCQSGSAQGFSALYTWMSRLPQVCRAAQSALAEHYDLASGPGTEFFDVLALQAQSHSKTLRLGLEQILTTYPEATDAAVHAAESAITAVKGMYMGTLIGTHTGR